jgi:hypothetical protein
MNIFCVVASGTSFGVDGKLVIFWSRAVDFAVRPDSLVGIFSRDSLTRATSRGGISLYSQSFKESLAFSRYPLSF